MVKIHPPQGNGSALELKSAYLSPEGSTTNLLVDETPSEGGNAKNPSSKWPEQNPDFATIRVVSKVVLFVLKKCWMICGVSFVTVFVIYWYCSSALALLLLMFSVSGNKTTFRHFIRITAAKFHVRNPAEFVHGIRTKQSVGSPT